MPIIRTYQPKTQVAGPVQIRRQPLTSPTGRATQALGKTIAGLGGALLKRENQADISSLNAEMSKAQAELTVDLQQTIKTAKPGDETISDKFNEKVKTRLGKIGENVSSSRGQQYFTTMSAKMEGQFLVSASRAQSHLAGVKARQDYTETSNSLSTSLIGDPSSLPLSLEMHSQSIDNLVSSGQLSSEDGAKLRTQGETNLSKASVRGWIKLDPEFAKEKLSAGDYDRNISGDLKAQLFREAEQGVRAREIEVQRQERDRKKALQVEQQKTQNTFLDKMEQGGLKASDILNSNLDPTTGAGSKKAFLNMLKVHASSTEKLKTNAETMIGLYERIHLPDGDPNKLVDENDLNQFFGSGLSLDDVKNLRKEMQDKGTQAGSIEGDLKSRVVDIAKGALSKSNPLTGLRDPVGDEQLQKFMVFFLQEYQAQRKKGKTASELLDPDSRDYLGKFINNYKRTPKQVMNSMARSVQPFKKIPLPGEVVKRKAGESAADYLKRKGK